MFRGGHIYYQVIYFTGIIQFHFSFFAAFGWCGDMGTAFQVVDEMIQAGIMVTPETMSFLLQACITNKETGFWHAMKVRVGMGKGK